jgi:hypothetical protein
MSITEQLDDLGPRALVEVLGEVYDRLISAPLWSLSEPDTLAHVKDLHAVEAKAHAARLLAVGEVESRGSALASGAPSTKAWLAGELRQRPDVAFRDVKVAEALGVRYAATAAALAQGRISADHAHVICRTLDGLPAGLPEKVLLEAEAELLAHALVFDPRTLAGLGRHLAYVLDPDGDAELAAHEASMRGKRELHLSARESGLWDLHGILDPEVGNTLWAVLDHLGPPKPSTADGPDPRSAPQRRFDAFEELIQRAMTAGDLPSQGGDAPP